MRIGSGRHTYEWIDSWAQLPDSPQRRAGWAHHGMATTSTGQVVTFHPGEPRILVFEPDGTLVRSVEVEVANAHGLCLVNEEGRDLLWLADNGAAGPAQVIKVDLNGRTLERLERPDLPCYREGRYAPTAVAVHEARFGGNGDVWVADGYGQSIIHRYDAQGHYLSSITGEEGAAGLFRTPHGLFVDRRKEEPELYIADRANRRIQVYDLEGRYKRSFGADVLSSPSAFAADPASGSLIVAELRARLAVLDPDDRLVGYLGENEAVCALPGWPNMKDEMGQTVRTTRLEPGRFNSPHGIAADAAGNLYVTEWLIGGRYTKLACCERADTR